MPKSIVELVGELAEKAGISKDDEKLKSFMTNSSLASVTIDDTIVQALNTQLLPIEAAKYHDDISKHHTGRLYAALDRNLDRFVDELDYQDATKADLRTMLLSEKSTFDRVPLLAKKLVELERQKSNALLKGDKKELQDAIDKLNDQLAKEVTEKKSIQESNTKQIADLNLSYLLDNDLIGYNFAFPEGMPMKIKLQTVKALINDELRKQGGQFIEENGALSLKKSDGTDFRNESHQKVNYKQFIDGVLSANKVLATSKPGKDAGKQNGNGQIIAGSDAPVDASLYLQTLEKRKADLMGTSN